MKVFCFFYNRFEDATTSIALAKAQINHTVLIHSHQDLEKFYKGGTLLGDPLVTDNPRGLAFQRNSALDQMKVGEWAAFLCDDINHIQSLPKEFVLSSSTKIPIDFENQQSFRLKKANEISLKTMFDFFPKLIEIADANKIHLIGFGLHTNPQNLRHKFGHRGLADGRFWLVKKSNYKFDLNAQLVDDVAWTAENLCRHGKVLILNWVVPIFKRYTAGGFGSQQERIELRKKECRYLAAKYSPLVRIASKPNWPQGTHVRLFGTEKNIIETRKKLGYIYK